MHEFITQNALQLVVHTRLFPTLPSAHLRQVCHMLFYGVNRLNNAAPLGGDRLEHRRALTLPYRLGVRAGGLIEHDL